MGLDFGLAGPTPMVRHNLGTRSRGEARRLGLQLAALCDAVAAAAAIWKEDFMLGDLADEQKAELVKKVVDTCQTAIGRAIENPVQAIGLARGLDTALTSLRLVQAEVMKGETGAFFGATKLMQWRRASPRDDRRCARSAHCPI